MEDEFTPKVQQKRNVLRPVLKLANQKDAYIGTCKQDADTLVIKGIKYMVKSISELPEEISAMKAAQKMNEKNTLCYFGELSPFSNLHLCRFDLHNTDYHSSEQCIQHARVKMFRDKAAASTILNSWDGFEAKMLGCTVKDFHKDTWLEHR